MAEHPIDATGIISNRLFDELTAEAERYLGIVLKLKALPLEHPDRAALEEALFTSLTHLGTHARISQEMLLEATLLDQEQPQYA